MLLVLLIFLLPQAVIVISENEDHEIFQSNLSPEDRIYYKKKLLSETDDDEVQISDSHKRTDIMLVDGNDESEGTVLVLINGKWGSICDDGWTLKEANIACQQLGFPIALQATTRDFFASNGQYPYKMDDLDCNGTESRMQQCRFWEEHDCSVREEAGVVCLNPDLKGHLYNPRNPQIKGMHPEDHKQMIKQSFQVTLGNGLHENVGTVLVAINEVSESKTVVGGICTDRFFGPEANVACRSLGFPLAVNYKKVFLKDPSITIMKPVLIVGHCFGNETNLIQCTTFASANGVPCKNQSLGIAVYCGTDLPDLMPDVKILETSARLQVVPLFQVTCALEENCFPPSVYSYFSRHPRSAVTMQRKLLRFTSNIHNIGTAVFKPFLPPEKWVWHACHSHYHSMKVFSSYEVIDSNHNLLAVGHKASFCLEDNSCEAGIKKHFVCSTSLSIRGDQGISPGCADFYLSEYDCQWIDVTDVPPGLYEFRAIFNPNLIVPEISYANNAVRCSLTIGIRGRNTILKNCRIAHPLDL